MTIDEVLAELKAASNRVTAMGERTRLLTLEFVRCAAKGDGVAAQAARDAMHVNLDLMLDEMSATQALAMKHGFIQHQP